MKYEVAEDGNAQVKSDMHLNKCSTTALELLKRVSVGVLSQPLKQIHPEGFLLLTVCKTTGSHPGHLHLFESAKVCAKGSISLFMSARNKKFNPL